MGEKMCLGNLQDVLMILENKSTVNHVWTHVVAIGLESKLVPVQVFGGKELSLENLQNVLIIGKWVPVDIFSPELD